MPNRGRGAFLQSATPGALLLPAALLFAGAARVQASDVLSSDTARILGVSLEISPVLLSGVPRNVPVLLSTRLLDRGNSDVSGLPEFSGLQARGVLSGPGLAYAVKIITVAGRPLELGTGDPSVSGGQASHPLSVPDTYTLDNLRLTTADGTTILPATPSIVTITVVDRVLSYDLTSRPLSLEEIRDRGIVIGGDRPCRLGDKTKAMTARIERCLITSRKESLD